MNISLNNILNKSLLSREDIVAMLSLTDPSEVAALFHHADEIRKQYAGDAVHLRGIIEISNHCKRGCLYCGLRNGNKELTRYRMEPGEIVEYAIKIAALPIHSIVIQAGEDEYLTAPIIADIVHRIKREANAAITLSLGEQSDETYRMWFDAGADRYLLKHETANAQIFKRLKPDASLQVRTGRLFALKRIGFQIGSGNMVGLPDQTPGDIADDILLCKELDVDMATFGPFIPSPETPLYDAGQGTVELSLKTIACARIVLKNVHIPANTAIATIDAEGREKALQCGANVVMPNFTPSRYRIHYQIYPNRRCITDEPLQCNGCIRAMIIGLGRTVADDYGHSLKADLSTSRYATNECTMSSA